MYLLSLPAAVPWNGGCLAVYHSSCRVRSSLQFRTWHLVQTSSQDTPAGPGCDLIWPCDGDDRKQAGSNTGQKSHPAFREEFVSYTDIEKAAARQGLSLHLETVGPFFQVRVFDFLSKEVLGTAQGLVKLWTCGRILHLDSVRLNSASLKAKRPIFGIAFLLGAAAVCHGYDRKCVKAELLAIKDSDTYHSKLVRYYTRMGFKSVYAVTGESLQDIPHLLIWGGVGTRMDASIEELFLKWSPALKKVPK